MGYPLLYQIPLINKDSVWNKNKVSDIMAKKWRGKTDKIFHEKFPCDYFGGEKIQIILRLTEPPILLGMVKKTYTA